MNYNGSYIYPSRPSVVTPSAGLSTYERMGFIAQPKMNGSCANVFLNGSNAKTMGRHRNLFTREIMNSNDLCALHRGNGWMVLTGERMDKSKKDFRNKPFSGLVVFDILVYNGTHLINSTFEERQNLLDNLFPIVNPFDDYIDKISENVYRAKNFKSDFLNIWNKMTQIDMYEGWVLKRPTGRLEKGLRENNNSGWQLKCRKATKNYSS